MPALRRSLSIMRIKQKNEQVLGLEMAYREVGKGDPIVFLHGNPTSSHLWRDVIPEVAEFGRCIAPDLVGMGDSQKIRPSGPNTYRFVEHRAYLDTLLDVLGVSDNVTLVVHDWGSGLGFDWARRHPSAVRGIAYMEAIVAPVPSWDSWPESARKIFQAMRSEAGEEIVLNKNVFVERILPASVLNPISEEDMQVYRAPYTEPGESRRPTLTWPRQLPIEGEPADVHEIVAEYASWLQETEIPKLLVVGDPGMLISGPVLEFCRSFKNQTEVTVSGLHFLQEDSGPEIGRAVAEWLRGL